MAGAKMYIAWYIKGYNIVERKVPYDSCVNHSMLIKFCPFSSHVH